MKDQWFPPPITWNYISLWNQLMVQSFEKLDLRDPHQNFGWQGMINEEDMVS